MEAPATGRLWALVLAGGDGTERTLAALHVVPPWRAPLSATA